MQNNYLPYQNVEGEDSSMMCKAFIFGKKLLLTIRCTTHFNDTNTFIATKRVQLFNHELLGYIDKKA